ncbi:MAG: fimbrillin family protein [Alistipes sp.]|nr:fimbrillin family protein [Alistipes sp.]
MRNIFSILAVATLLIVGCEKHSDSNSVVDTNQIRFETTISRVEGNQFEQGDSFGLYAVEYAGEDVAELQVGGNYLNNEVVTLSDGVWTPERALYWSAKPCDFYAIYPLQNIEAMEDVLFHISTDQSIPSADGVLGGYEASDIMWAKAEKHSREDGAVKLAFQHMMSKLVVDIVRGPSYEGELPENIEVHIYNTATTARVNWRIGSLEKYLYSENKTIKMKQIDSDSFEAIVVPQFIERSTPLVEVTMEGIAYLLEYDMSFRPGIQQTITVTLNTSPDQEKIEISIDGDAGDWE